MINYASAHDNETLFDIISVKFFVCLLVQTLMNLSIDERCRKNNLSTSMIALSQVSFAAGLNLEDGPTHSASTSSSPEQTTDVDGSTTGDVTF
ncbi:hypothetical protein ZEAMMB73_Zm00001d035952 [Zea mays]|uniref:Uncharacterized protein n=1 Tax=Zea mays TaxID=4577 RepID=A0A1D6LJU4_MAIZE|nr:hypothetical protein ZEAMMB73_Zm00001d035952 [Zea mays]